MLTQPEGKLTVVIQGERGSDSGAEKLLGGNLEQTQSPTLEFHRLFRTVVPVESEVPTRRRQNFGIPPNEYDVLP